MQQLLIKISGLLVLALFGIQAQAEGDSDYPAAYFEPIITYQDPGLASFDANAAEPQAAAVDLPAASGGSGVEQDDRYPAAYFEPTIVFQDLDAIKKVPVPKSKPAPKAKSATSSVSNKPGVSTSGSSFPFLGLLIVVALFGYIYWSTSKEKTGKSSAVVGDVGGSDAAEAALGDDGESGAAADGSKTVG